MNLEPDMTGATLVVDLGNTATKLGWFAGDGTLSGFRSFVDGGELLRYLEALDQVPGAVAIGRSGAREALRIIGKHFEGIAPVTELRAELPGGIASDYAAGQAGTDRLANVAGAVALGLHPCVIVDAGSAITLELVDGRPGFAGGVILPGIDLQARALQRGTADLPGIALGEDGALPGFPGTSTRMAMEAGIVLGAVEAVNGLVNRGRLALGGGDDVAVIYTGGNGGMFAAESRQARATYDRHLTLHGLYAMYQAQGRGGIRESELSD